VTSDDISVITCVSHHLRHMHKTYCLSILSSCLRDSSNVKTLLRISTISTLLYYACNLLKFRLLLTDFVS